MVASQSCVVRPPWMRRASQSIVPSRPFGAQWRSSIGSRTRTTVGRFVDVDPDEAGKVRRPGFAKLRERELHLPDPTLGPMARPKGEKLIADNRRARHDYH